MKKFTYIDSLRGVAVILVLFVHSGFFFNMNLFPNYFRSIQGIGASGVQLFFILSAFTLFMSYENRLKSENNSIRNFFIRRFFRIAPLYYLMLIVGLFYFGLGERYWLGDLKEVSVLNIISHFTFWSGLNPYYMNSIIGVEWSIGVEMLFYLLIPVLFRTIKNINISLKLFLISLVLVLFFNSLLSQMNVIRNQALWNSYLFYSLPYQFPVFVLGIILYFIIVKKEYNFDKYFMFFCFVLFVLGFKIQILKVYSISIFLSLFVVLVSKFHIKLIVNKVFVFIGRISYSIYLIHIFCIEIILKFIKPSIESQTILCFFLYFLVLLITTSMISYLSYLFIEQNSVKLGNYIIDKLDKKANSSRIQDTL